VFLQASYDGKVSAVGVFRAFLGLDITKSSKQSLGQYLKTRKSASPIVIFPEGTTSNGKAILSFLPILSDLALKDLDSTVTILGLKYPYQNYCPAYTTGSKWWHFANLLGQVFYFNTVFKFTNNQDYTP
jgi:1-acyl-sn-glycerol-3-phosphate acyltransferase